MIRLYLQPCIVVKYYNILQYHCRRQFIQLRLHWCLELYWTVYAYQLCRLQCHRYLASLSQPQAAGVAMQGLVAPRMWSNHFAALNWVGRRGMLPPLAPPVVFCFVVAATRLDCCCLRLSPPPWAACCCLAVLNHSLPPPRNLFFLLTVFSHLQFISLQALRNFYRPGLTVTKFLV